MVLHSTEDRYLCERVKVPNMKLKKAKMPNCIIVVK